ncbi:MAG: hypothetical protein ABJA64_00915 [Candidatus Saccharibacteria bacterium]
MFSRIKPTPQEVAKTLPGDEIITHADVTMDRAFTLKAIPEEVWPWLMQLGKNRSGWYFPRLIERFIPPKKRALRSIEPKLQNLKVGSVIDDWGGRDATFEVAQIEENHHIVHISTRGKISMSWAIVLEPSDGDTTRVHFRLRLAPVSKKWLAESGGGFIDALTIAGLEAGLRERISKSKSTVGI